MKKNEGITLIALIITIIILIILTAITLNNVIGTDLIGFATKAAENYTDAEKEEGEEIDKLVDTAYELSHPVEQVNDDKPGELETEDDTTYVINSVEDLIRFSYDVRNGTNYEGKTVKLGTSLNFNSDKSYADPTSTDYAAYGYEGDIKNTIRTQGFIPIGSLEFTEDTQDTRYAKTFQGTFDGNGNKIYNLKINYSSEDVGTWHEAGFFTNNCGIIKNLGIEDGNVNFNIDSELFSSLGILCGRSEPDAIIENCYTTGVINTTFTGNVNVCGICGSNAGLVRSCYNKADVNVAQKSSDYTSSARIAGVVGANETGSKLENVYNTGNISLKYIDKLNKANQIIMAGVTGLGTGSIEKVYSIGTVKFLGEKPSSSLAGERLSGCIGIGQGSDCFYLKDTLTPLSDNYEINANDTAKSADEMKTDDFLNLLNKDNTNEDGSAVWKKDTGINDGYPILSWQ